MRVCKRKQMGLDRITNLPANVIDTILSCMPLRDAVRTSVLSSEWRYKWMIPELVFEDGFPLHSDIWNGSEFIPSDGIQLTRIIDQVLLLHTGAIRTFKLAHGSLREVHDIDRWILVLSRRGIREFILEIMMSVPYILPSSFFSCNQLSHIDLYNCVLRTLPPSFRGFADLTSLCFEQVSIRQDVLESLISKCPLLNNLQLWKLKKISHLKICAPNLEFFEFEGVFEDITFKNAALLHTVGIHLDANKCRNDRTCNLIKFLDCLPGIRKLEVQKQFIKYLSVGSVPLMLPVMCVNLEYLSIYMDFEDVKQSPSAFCLIKSSPNLEELHISAYSRKPVRLTVGSFWSPVKDLNFSFKQLRIVKIVGITGSSTEMDFINFILAYSPALEKVTVQPAPQSKNGGIAKDLLRFRRASTQVEIIYLDS